MDHNLLNFWINYENIINWGYRISGARGSDSDSSLVTIDTETKVGCALITGCFVRVQYSYVFNSLRSVIVLIIEIFQEFFKVTYCILYLFPRKLIHVQLLTLKKTSMIMMMFALPMAALILI